MKILTKISLKKLFIVFFFSVISVFSLQHSNVASAAIAPSFDTSSTAAVSGAGTLTWTHTVTTTGARRILVVSFMNRNVSVSALASSVTYNGVALTSLGSVQTGSGGNYDEIWYLLNPATGAHSVTITVAANGGSEILNAVASSWLNVDQTTPFGTPVAVYNPGYSAGAQTQLVSPTTIYDTVLDSIILNNSALITHTGTTTTVNSSTGSYSDFQDQTPGTASSTTINYTNSALADIGIVAAPMHGSDGTFTISGSVYNDANNNGIKDAGETGYAGATVTLSGAATATATSASDGSYSFPNLVAGSYTVTITAPTGYAASSTNPVTSTISSNSTINFGLHPTVYYSISGFAFNDANSNGIKDAGETGYAGAIIKLSGLSTASTTSAADGSYSFSNLPTGNYTVTVTVPAGLVATSTNPVSISLGANNVTNFGLGVAPAPVAMPVVSWGKPISASTTSGTNAVTNLNTAPGNLTTNATYDVLNNYNWQSTVVPAWVALDLSTVPVGQRGKVDLLWYNNTNAYQCCLIGSGGSFSGLPSNYTIEANAAAGGTAAPATGWLTLTTVTGNVYHEREHVIDLTGYNWVRMNISTVNGTDTTVQLMHLDIFDLSGTAGVPQDSWFFIGDSITLSAVNYAQVFFQSVLNFTYSTQIKSQLPSYYPAQTDGGIVGASTSDGVNNISAWLAAFPGRYVDVSYGTNDATGNVAPATFYNNYVTIIQAILNAGKIPLVSKIPWASNTTTQANVPALNAQIDSLYLNFPQIVKGPDFYKFFYNNQSEMGSGGVHPVSQGYADMRNLWACSSLVNVYQVARATVAASANCSALMTYIPSSSAPYSISGSVYNDANRNGIKDAGETAYAGAIVTLSGAASVTTTSAADGSYSFSNLVSGNYTLTITVPAGLLVTSTNPVSITALSANNTTNFGLAPPYTISGTVFNDTNRNGTKDAGETAYAGATVALSGASSATATSAADGSYSFPNLAAGNYTVTITVPGGLVATSTNPVLITALSANNTTNFGLAPATIFYSISGNVFIDSNNNGVKDVGENTGVQTTLTLSGGSNLSTVSAIDGTYSFINLPAGNYTVKITVPNSYAPSSNTSVSLALSANNTTNFGLVYAAGGGFSSSVPVANPITTPVTPIVVPVTPQTPTPITPVTAPIVAVPQNSPNPSNFIPAAPSRLVKINNTYYIIQNTQKYAIPSSRILFTYGFDFNNAVAPTNDELALPVSSNLMLKDGSLVRFTGDRRIYIISNSLRRPFASQRLFLKLGYKLKGVLRLSVADGANIPLGDIIKNSSAAHFVGTDIVYKNTIYYIDVDGLHAYSSLDVYNSWHKFNDFSAVAKANNNDLLLPKKDPRPKRLMNQ
ncbi:MAG: hypothetical protein NVS3B9_5820 [Candidatus Doudnabacteria bacterium]